MCGVLLSELGLKDVPGYSTFLIANYLMNYPDILLNFIQGKDRWFGVHMHSAQPTSAIGVSGLESETGSVSV